MDIAQFIREKEEQLFNELETWNQSIGLHSGQKLTLCAEVGPDNIEVRIKLQYTKKKLNRVIDRELTFEELDQIIALQDYNNPQRRLVIKFTRNGNQPMSRHDLKYNLNHITQINALLRSKGIPFGIHALSRSHPKKGENYWAQLVCFRPIEW